MRTYLVCAGVVLAMMIGRGIANAKGDKSFEGTVVEVGPSPYANRGGLARVVLEKGTMRIVFHILKTTKITRPVGGKAQAGKVEDVKKGAACKAVYDGQLMESNPPQGWAKEVEIVKPAE